MKYTIHRIHPAPLARFGCFLGALASLLPSLLCSLGALHLLGFVHRWLEGWQEGKIEMLGFTATLDFVELLGLEPALKLLQSIGPIQRNLLLLAVIVMSMASGLLLALTAYVTGLGYNVLALLTDGLVVDLREVRTPDSRHQV
jgi:hypothetical protein